MNVPNEDITILVADDVFTNIEFLRYILRKENYNIIPVSNGAEAIEQVEKGSVDLILLDVMMPDLDGFEVCRRLKSKEEFSEIPIIFLTARTDVESTVKGFELGAVDYVTKPFHRQELLARVKNHIELQKVKEFHIRSKEKYRKHLGQFKVKSEQILSEIRVEKPNCELIEKLVMEINESSDFN